MMPTRRGIVILRPAVLPGGLVPSLLVTVFFVFLLFLNSKKIFILYVDLMEELGIIYGFLQSSQV